MLLEVNFDVLGLKYFVERTKIGGNLPIYTEYRNGGNTCYTLIKKISGDTRKLSDDLMKHFTAAKLETKVEADAKKIAEKLKNKWKIREELGHIWVHGKHTETLRKFLESKGF